ncbi:hypothetical protein [Candidatus Ichthyocystis sparus]|uniref:hypothetical protein n=1 Tax=Candidatus Ichthyocystis sparus TaxID=1561004 RepID=UPI000B879B3D|nr:hypothetical protein [Candidatus Ichthyocystis sparus]
MNSIGNVLGTDGVDSLSTDTLDTESANVIHGSMDSVSLVEGSMKHSAQSSSRIITRFSNSSPPLLALSLLSLLPGILAEDSSTSSQNTSVVTAATTTVGAMMSTSSTTSGDIDVLKDTLETVETVVYCILAVVSMVVIATFFDYMIRRTAQNNRGGNFQQGGALGGNNAGGQPNGNVVVGHRDPDDHPGEIMELREADREWEHIPGEVIPMVAMGGNQGEEEREEEDAV